MKSLGLGRYAQRAFLIVTTLPLLSNCAPRNPTTQTTDIRVRCRDAGRNAVRLWRCLNPRERTAFMQQLLKPSPPAHAAVDWNDAVVLSADNKNGLRLVPVHLSGDKWAVMVWSIHGEFESYVGLRRL
jgi:hypothetical protein